MRRLLLLHAVVTIDILLFTLVAVSASGQSSSRRPSSSVLFHNTAVYKKEVNALFARSPYLKRPIAWSRGGSSSSSSSSEQEEKEEFSSSDDNWTKVSAVLDIKSAFFGEDDEGVKDMKQRNDTGTSEQTEIVELDETLESTTTTTTDDSTDKEVLPTEEEEEEEEEEIEATNKTKELLLKNLTFYASKHGDGSESDPDGLPRRFLTMQKGCRKKAKEAFDATVSWRNQFDINNILAKPHPQFDACKVIFPHYFPGRDPQSNIIFVQRVGYIDMDVAHRNNVSMDDLIMHYVYIVEYCWNLIEPGPPDGIMTNVIDMKGMKFEKLRNREMIHFAKRFVSIMSSNYPSRSYKTLVINAPKWFNMGYKLFKPLLRESTKEKIHIYARGKEQDEALKQYLGDSVPVELLSTGDDGGDDHGETQWQLPTEISVDKDASENQREESDDDDEPTPGPESKIERELRTFCMNILEEAGSPMNEVMA